MSAIHKTPTGEEIPKEVQIVDLKDLHLKCQEIVLMLEMKRNGLVNELSERRILERFSFI